MKSRRGTSNKNHRGNTTDRQRRRAYLMRVYESDQGPGTVRCYRCGRLLFDGSELTERTMTIDRIVPGAHGGKYVRSNIRPACVRCNSETGALLSGSATVLRLRAYDRPIGEVAADVDQQRVLGPPRAGLRGAARADRR